MLTLILPTEANRNDVLAFYGAFEKTHETCIGYHGHEDYDAWLRHMRCRFTGTGLPEGYVRENFYLCYDGDEMIGVFSLKFDLTPYLLDFGGHVGYAVAPARRNRGLASEILRLGLEIARGFGFERLLAICDEDNVASEKVILRNGGIFENKLFDGEEGVFVKRYWIAL